MLYINTDFELRKKFAIKTTKKNILKVRKWEYSTISTVVRSQARIKTFKSP